MKAKPPEPSEALRAQKHRAEHAHCFACGEPSAEQPGLALAFALSGDGAGVEAEWLAPVWATSYEGLVHGGLLATVLDAAMVHALFAHGISGRTAALHLRYRHPVVPAKPCQISAQLLETRGPLHRLQACIHQDGRLCASAEADFLAAPTHPTTPLPPPTRSGKV
ncbi:MAG: hypothetical protein RL376_273 [Verrucomicrobiota bacterium]